MSKFLVSDANIVIDLEAGELLEAFFQLPYQFITPDILFEQELKIQHSHLLSLGLKLVELTENSMLYAFNLKQEHNPTSLNDLFCLSLAKQEQYPLLTGDRALRKVAALETVQTNGTIWIIKQLVLLQIIDKQRALFSLELMKNKGRRLPWEKAKEIINDIPD